MPDLMEAAVAGALNIAEMNKMNAAFVAANHGGQIIVGICAE